MPKNRIRGVGEGSPSSTPTLFGLALTLALGLVASGCGLESTLNYNVPMNFNPYSGNAITLQHDTTNGGIGGFFGYDVYYHVYANETDATNAVSMISTAIDTTTYTPSQSLAKLKNYGFIRMAAFSDVTDFGTLLEPVFKVSAPTAAANFSISIDNSTDWFFSLNSSSTKTTLFRNIGNSNYLSFNTPYFGNGSDVDYTGNIAATASTTVYVAMFAVAYGVDSTFTPINSYPSYGFEIPYTLPPTLIDRPTN